MPRGRKSTWDPERIAEKFNWWYGSNEPNIDAAEVRALISRYESLFHRQVQHQGPQEAVWSLRRVADGWMTADDVLRGLRSTLVDVPLLRTFRRKRNYDPQLPSWFLRVVRAWLQMFDRAQRNTPQWWVPKGADHSESISRSFYLMADCLRDERFDWAMRRVKAIWRMREHDATTWFRWLYDQQENSIRRLFPSGTPSTEMMHGCESYGQGGGMGLANPVDDRRVEGDLTHGPYGLPLKDYKCHLRQLVRLAGGDPTEGLWQDWVERLLWSLTRREIVFRSPDNGTWQTPLLRNGFLLNAWCAQGRDIPHAPPMKPYVSTVRTDGNIQMMIRFPSRMVSLTHFPKGLRHDLLDCITSHWGLYRTPLTMKQRIAYLRRLSRVPRGKQTEENVLEALWQEREPELVKMSIPEQVHVERLAVRRFRDRQRRHRERARRRLHE